MASSNGGTILPPAESRDLAEWNQLDDSDRDEEQEVGRKGRWKGKSKMADFGADDPEIGISTRMTSSMDDERGAGNESGRSYPPLSEEAAEERAVIEVSYPIKTLLFARSFRDICCVNDYLGSIRILSAGRLPNDYGGKQYASLEPFRLHLRHPRSLNLADGRVCCYSDVLRDQIGEVPPYYEARVLQHLTISSSSIILTGWFALRPTIPREILSGIQQLRHPMQHL